MGLSRRCFLGLAAGAVVAPAIPRTSVAQGYPTRPITMIVPFPAGGPSDAIMRIVADRMKDSLGQPILIENLSGAAGSIGAGKAARAAPDGYTLIQGDWGTHVANSAIYDLFYDVAGDFAPIALLSVNSQIIVAKKSLPANDLNEFVAWLRANPDKATAGTYGVGSASHIFGLFFQAATGTRFQFVPYRGLGPAMQDLMGGQIDFMLDSVANSLPQVRSGTIKAYAITAERRLAVAPDIPTVDESGLSGFYTSFWRAIFAPRNTPKAIIARVNAAVVSATADPVVRSRLADLGVSVPPRGEQTPETLMAMQKAEIEKWWPIIKAAGIKAE